jgi:hypothetical protein
VRWGYSWKISQAQVPLSTVLDGIVETQQQTINGVVNPIAVKKRRPVSLRMAIF